MHAATRVWQPTTGTNDYNTPANWSSSTMPVAGDVAYFAGSGTQTVSLSDSPPTVANFATGTTGGTLTFESIKSTPGDLSMISTSTDTFGNASGGNIVFQKSGTSDFLIQAAALTVGIANQSNNTVTVQGAGVTLRAATGLLIVGFDTGSDNNLVHVKQGAALESWAATIGRGGANNSTVRLSDAGTAWTLSGNPTTGYNLTLGVSGGSDNSLIVENGALLRSTVELRAYRGTVHLDNGTIDLTYDSGGYTTDQAFVMQAAGRLRGQGNLKAASLSSSQSGAIVEVGESGFGILATEFTGAGWNNTNISLQLGIGDMTGSSVAGVDYDWLNINGNFTFGGSLTIDLATAVLPGSYDFALINWTNSVGNYSNMAVSFINGTALDYAIRGDGFYIVPEPSTAALLLGALGMAALGIRRRERRR